MNGIIEDIYFGDLQPRVGSHDKNGKLKLSSTIERFVDITGEQTDMAFLFSKFIHRGVDFSCL